RVPKDHLRVRAYGEVDELNAAIGFAATLEPVPFESSLLQAIQRDLFTMGAELASKDPGKLREVLDAADVGALEKVIDRYAAGLFQQLDELLKRHCPAAAYALISDSHVGKLYGEPLAAQLEDAGVTVRLFTFPAGEWNKTRDTWAALSDRMLAAQLGRDCAVIALGGGVVSDVGGFVAATYLRGVPLVQAPTSLLAMIDSSIGGKTGVDVAAG